MFRLHRDVEGLLRRGKPARLVIVRAGALGDTILLKAERSITMPTLKAVFSVMI